MAKKYIDAEKLRAEIERLLKINTPYESEGYRFGLLDLRSFIDSLQQEQPEVELTEFERGIKRGFLCAGLEDVPTEIIKETAKELLEIAKKELCKDCCVNLDWYARGRLDEIYKENRVYKHEGPTFPAFWPPCHYGGECTNPFHDCINCHRQSTDGISTTTGTSAAKVEG